MDDDMLSMLMGSGMEEEGFYADAEYDMLRGGLEHVDPDVAGRMSAYIDQLAWLSMQYGALDYGAEEDEE